MVKEEVRILVADLLPDDMVVFVILRGVKGVEHVGFLKGGLDGLLRYLRDERLLDELRYLVLRDAEVLEVRGGKLVTTVLNNSDAKFISGLALEGRRVVKLILKELKPLIKQ